MSNKDYGMIKDFMASIIKQISWTPAPTHSVVDSIKGGGTTGQRFLYKGPKVGDAQMTPLMMDIIPTAGGAGRGWAGPPPCLWEADFPVQSIKTTESSLFVPFRIGT